MRSIIIMIGVSYLWIRQLVTKVLANMQMTEGVAMVGAQLLAVVILLGCRLVQMHGGSALVAHLQEVLGTGRAGIEVAPEAGAGAESEVEPEAEVEVLILTVGLSGGLREAECLEDLLCSAEILQLVDAEEACIAGFLMKMAGAGSSMSIILQTHGKGMPIRRRILWIHENQMTFPGAGNLEVIMMMVLGKDLNPEEITGLLSNAMSLSKEGAAEVQVADMFMMIPRLILDGETRLGKLLMVEVVLIHPLGIGLRTGGRIKGPVNFLLKVAAVVVKLVHISTRKLPRVKWDQAHLMSLQSTVMGVQQKAIIQIGANKLMLHMQALIFYPEMTGKTPVLTVLTEVILGMFTKTGNWKMLEGVSTR